MARIKASFLLLFFAVLEVQSFAPPRPVTWQPAVEVREHFRFTLQMAEESSTDPSSEQQLKAHPTSGTYYDDEVDPIPASKQGISNSMKERLIREASAGLDSEAKQSNVILYIIGAIAVLVLLGGQGIFY